MMARSRMLVSISRAYLVVFGLTLLSAQYPPQQTLAQDDTNSQTATEDPGRITAESLLQRRC